MSCRQWVSSAVRQCRAGLAQQQQPQQLPRQLPRAFSTTADVAALRDIPSIPTKPSPRAARRVIAGSNPTEALHGMLTAGMERGAPPTPEQQRLVMEQQQSPKAHISDLRSNAVTDNYVRQMPRRWKIGEVYAPRDISPVEMSKWRHPKRPRKDIVDLMGFNPLDNYRNFSLISEFMTTMGRIRHSSETGLRPVNQRKMAKAIRRAVGMGLHPSVHRHPEILRTSRHSLPQQNIPTPSDPSQNFL